MTKPYLLLFILIHTIGVSFGQKHEELFSIKIGYSSTNIVFKEAIEPTFQFLGNTFKSGKTFVGEGIEFGAGKSINDKPSLARCSAGSPVSTNPSPIISG